MDRLLWTQILDTGPPSRRFAAMAYDSDRDRVVLFGGGVFVPVGPDDYPTEMPGQDTWEFDGEIWMQLEDMGPPARPKSVCDTIRVVSELFYMLELVRKDRTGYLGMGRFSVDPSSR